VKLFFLTKYMTSPDFTYVNTDLSIWTTTECNIGIVAASFPALKPLFKRVLGGSSYNPSGYINNSSPYKSGYARQNSKPRLSRAKSGMSGLTDLKDEYELKSPTVASVTATSRAQNRTIDQFDNISDESILPLQSHDGDDRRGIMKTMEVQVTRDKVWRKGNGDDRV
jgi:hypothetical protein